MKYIYPKILCFLLFFSSLETTSQILNAPPAARPMRADVAMLKMNVPQGNGELEIMARITGKTNAGKNFHSEKEMHNYQIKVTFSNISSELTYKIKPDKFGTAYARLDKAIHNPNVCNVGFGCNVQFSIPSRVIELEPGQSYDIYGITNMGNSNYYPMSAEEHDKILEVDPSGFDPHCVSFPFSRSSINKVQIQREQEQKRLIAERQRQEKLRIEQEQRLKQEREEERRRVEEQQRLENERRLAEQRKRKREREEQERKLLEERRLAEKKAREKSQDSQNSVSGEGKAGGGPTEMVTAPASLSQTQRSSKKSYIEKQNERDQFHAEHVRKNNEAYYKRQEALRLKQEQQRKQVAQYQEKQRQKYIAELERRKAEYERKQKIREEKWAAQMERNRIDRENLARAQDQAGRQIENGNFMGAGQTMANEFARQGNITGTYVAAGLGVLGEALKVSAENKAKEKEAERRRQEQLRIARERERKREELLARQQREFNSMVNEIRREQQRIVNARETFIKAKINYTKTYDKFSKNGEPIYVFYVETAPDYNFYKENVRFPNTAEIEIKQEASLRFSPIIAVYPNSSGEYPFLKDLLSRIAQEYLKGSKSIYKIYNWSQTLEEIQTFYSTTSEKALQANFSPILPKGEMLVVLNQENNSKASGKNYWTNGQQEEQVTSNNNNYWESSQQQTSRVKEPSRPDYWSTSNVKVKDTVPTSNSKEKTFNYWQQNQK